MKRRIHLLNILAAALLLSGCMGYQLGGSRPEGIETVSMKPVVNATAEPAIELQVTHALHQRIQRDGRLKLVNANHPANAVIEVRLTEYQLTPVAYSDDFKTTPDMYRLRITGKAELRNAKTDKVLSKSTTYGEASFRFSGDLTSAKRDALPRAAEELAKLMIDDLIERW